MRFGSVCSGIEAASVAWHPLGWTTAWLAEIEQFPSAVLAHHYPQVQNLGDMTSLPERILGGEVEAPDVFCGGTPCQAFSVAGLRKSLDDARGNLSLTFCEIADAIDTIRAQRGQHPAVIFWENVPGVLSTKDNAFGCFLAGLAGESGELQPPGGRWSNAGCVLGPQRAVAWRVLDAQYFGLAQRRRRVFVVASARKGFDPAQVLFEWDGVRRDTAPSREARQTAPTIPSRSTAGGGLGTDFDCDGGLQVAGTMKACKDSGGWSNSADHAAAGYMVPVGTICVATGQAGAEIGADMAPTLNCNHEAPYVAHSLRGEGFDASEDGTGRGTPLVPVGVTIHGTDPTVQKVASYSEVAQCLRARTPGNIDNSSTTVVQQPVAYGIRTANTSSNGWGIQEECTHTLDCAQGVAVAVALRGREGGATAELGDEVQNCLRASSGGGDKPHVLTAMQVRRLTPEECEALQGFPRSYTAIPWRGKPADQCPDGPRYKALGNSWAVPNVRWIGERIARQINSSTTSPHPAGFFKTTP
jgi:DNA (cytosine-5)-methyltransferase 1